MPTKTSPELLANLFRKFQRRALASTGVKLSMRKVSEELLSQTAPENSAAGPGVRTTAEPALKRLPDVNALGRWTKPGTKRNWFIPVGRIVDVAQQLGATDEERDALMLARLAEIAEYDPKHDVLVCGAWVAERVAEQHKLDADEQAVLDAFRKSRAVSPYSTLSPSRLAKLQRLLDELAREHLAELVPDEDLASETALELEANAGLHERRAALVASLRDAQVSVKKPAQVSAQVLARRFLRSLRKP